MCTVVVQCVLTALLGVADKDLEWYIIGTLLVLKIPIHMTMASTRCVSL